MWEYNVDFFKEVPFVLFNQDQDYYDVLFVGVFDLSYFVTRKHKECTGPESTQVDEIRPKETPPNRGTVSKRRVAVV